MNGDALNLFIGLGFSPSEVLEMPLKDFELIAMFGDGRIR